MRIIIVLIVSLLLFGSARAQDATLYLPQVGGQAEQATAAEVPIILDDFHAIIVNCTGKDLTVTRITATALQLICK